MALNSFRKEYKQAVEELPKLHLEAGEIQDELHHRRMEQRWRGRMVVRGCTAAMVFLLCGAGTVAAKNYMSSSIDVRENGYTVTGSEEDYGVAVCDGAGIMARGLPAEEGEYESLEAFLDNSPVAERIPDISLLAREFEKEQVFVREDGMTIYVMVTEEGRYFSLMQADYRGVEGYSSATAYTGTTVNERNYTNSQGMDYVVFDTMEENGEAAATHAVISIEGRELSMDFGGFDADTIERVLKDLELTVYFTE